MLARGRVVSIVGVTDRRDGRLPIPGGPGRECDHRPVSRKEELRRELRARRAALDPEEVTRSSRAVLAQLREAVDWASLRRAHVYRSVAAWGELDTAGPIAWVQEAWPGVEVVVPSLRRDQPLPEEPFDLIVVPVLGFDRANNRLGLGGGWYDRFLAEQRQADTIGLAYGWALIPEGLPVEPHDVPLRRIVTEGGVQERS